MSEMNRTHRITTIFPDTIYFPVNSVTFPIFGDVLRIPGHYRVVQTSGWWPSHLNEEEFWFAGERRTSITFEHVNQAVQLQRAVGAVDDIAVSMTQQHTDQTVRVRVILPRY